MTDVWRVYEKAAAQWAQSRTRLIGEEAYLDRILAALPPKAHVLDIGCGTGHPIARHFIERGFAVTGVDAAPAMLAMCRDSFPSATFIETDMRTLALKTEFGAVIAWDSFFHLSHEDQRAMFPIFAEHTAARGFLLFTSGPDHGEAIGELHGHPLYHASLGTPEYRTLLDQHGFDVLLHVVDDPKCGRHTIWLAQRRGTDR